MSRHPLLFARATRRARNLRRRRAYEAIIADGSGASDSEREQAAEHLRRMGAP
jgi:hypothetical protein